MRTGILICGLNGTGKSTLGKALAEKLNYHFIDNEDLYFPKTDPRHLYASPRSRSEVEGLLLQQIEAQDHFVFASVKGDYGEAVISRFQCAVLIQVPRQIRLQRVRNRSFQLFGARMLPGGDLYDSEERFFTIVESRPENSVEEWACSLNCPVIRIDGTRPVAENLGLLTEYMAAALPDDRSASAEQAYRLL